MIKSFVFKLQRIHQDRNNRRTTTTRIALPYAKNVSEMIACILKPVGTSVAHQFVYTLRKVLPNINEPTKRWNNKREITAKLVARFAGFYSIHCVAEFGNCVANVDGDIYSVE